MAVFYITLSPFWYYLFSFELSPVAPKVMRVVYVTVCWYYWENCFPIFTNLRYLPYLELAEPFGIKCKLCKYVWQKMKHEAHFFIKYTNTNDQKWFGIIWKGFCKEREYYDITFRLNIFATRHNISPCSHICILSSTSFLTSFRMSVMISWRS